MIGLEELYNWILLNFLWIGIYLLVLERIFWEFQPRSGEILEKIIDYFFDNPGFSLFSLGCWIVFSTFITETKGIWIYGDNGWSGESTRSVILVLGALGGIYGLLLSVKRLEKFSDQVDISQKQAETSEKNLFNDRFSRAIEAIGHESLTIRNSGLRLLHSLGRDVQNGSRERNLVVQILHGYIRDRAMMPEKPKNGFLPEPEAPEKRADIVLGIELLSDLVPPADRDEVALDNLDFRGLIFKPQQDFQKINLVDANLQGAYLYRANLQGAVLLDANLQGANLSNANLQDAYLNNADISDVIFLQVASLTQEQLNDCLYKKDKPPKYLPEGLEWPKDRAYKWEGIYGRMCRYFVHNGWLIDFDTPWWYEGDKNENENKDKET